MKYQRLGDLLTGVGVISDEQLSAALKLQKGSGKRLGTVLIEHGFISETQLIEALQLQLGIDFIDLNSKKVPSEMALILSKNIARKYTVIPVKLVRDELYLAMLDPLNFLAIEEVKAATQKKVVPMISTKTAIERAIANLYGNEGAVRAIEDMSKEAPEKGYGAAEAGLGIHLVEEVTNTAPTIRLVNSIIERAVTEKASDIHLEPREGSMVIRMRIDGILRVILSVPKKFQGSVISRLKVMGGMDIAERRIPQDGRANVRVRNQDIDVRMSTIPTIYGEKVVLRLLNKNTELLTMEGIGLFGSNLDKFKNLIRKNANGVILLVGPTGSGKSSSMYTMISELNTEEVNLVTLENPVEYNIDGVNQVQINEKAGMTFGGGLRSILRQDPDIIAVGEIRDGETAEIAMRAALTGHLVLTTVHTNDAVSALDRLFDLGVEPYLIASAVRGIISQRLVRRICPNCRKAYSPTDEDLEKLQMTRQETAGRQFCCGAGCSECFHTGYRGRIAVFEILQTTQKIKQMIYERAPRRELQKAIHESGFSPMIENCRQIVLDGITTVEEVYRAIYSTDM